MKGSEKETVKKWVDTWKRAGDALEEIKRKELTSVGYGKDLTLTDEMLLWAHEHRKERLTSGLVDQQRIFKKIAKKLR